MGLLRNLDAGLYCFQKQEKKNKQTEIKREPNSLMKL